MYADIFGILFCTAILCLGGIIFWTEHYEKGLLRKEKPKVQSQTYIFRYDPEDGIVIPVRPTLKLIKGDKE